MKTMRFLVMVATLFMVGFVGPFDCYAEGGYDFATKWGTSGTSEGQFTHPYGIALDSSGNVYVADTENDRIQKFSSTGTYIAKWGSVGTGDGQMDDPYGIAVDSSGNVYIADSANNRIQKFSSQGTFTTKWGSLGSGDSQFNTPYGIAVDSSGNVYTVDKWNYRIQKFSSAGTFATKWGSSGTGSGQFDRPYHAAVDSSGNVYIADAGNDRIQKFSSTGTFITSWGSTGAGDGQFNHPSGIAVDSSDNVYVTDTKNDRVQKFSSTGTYVAKWGSTGSGDGQFNWPRGIAADSSGNVYIADTNNYRIQKFSPSSTTTWIYSNSIGARNSIKITDMSGSLSSSGAAITITAWDVNGNSIAESSSATPLTLYNNGTTTIAGTSLAARFPAGTPLLYALSTTSSKYIITNVKSSSDGTLNVPNGYNSGTTKFVANSVGPRNSIKITDMSGSLASTGASITVAAWDVNGTSLTESGSAASLKLYSYGTTTIAGTDLAARFPSGTPMSYEFTVDSSKYVITNVKSSSDGSINIPYAYTSGSTNFVANSIGPRNTIKISDVSGALSSSGASITVTAWDVNGNALTESGSAMALKLYNRGTTSITGTELAARFTGGTPMAYEFTSGSSKYIITNVKSSSDGSINIPAVYTSGTTAYASNNVSSLSTVKITDASGSLSSSGASISVAAWDAAGNVLTESSGATPLALYSNGTTSISGTALAARFPTGTPILYEFTVASSKYIVTNVTSNTAGTLTIPGVYASGVTGGI